MTTSLYTREGFRLVTTLTWQFQPGHQQEQEETVGHDRTNSHLACISLYTCLQNIWFTQLY